MNEYNERVLKTVLQDYRAENDAELLKEIEEAKNDPLFMVSDEEAKEFAQKYAKNTQKKKNSRLFMKVASVILAVVLAGAILVPVTVQGRKNTLAEHLIYYISSEFLSFGTDKNSSLLLSYEGEFVPSYIPEGYSVDFVNNSKDVKELVLKDSNGKKIVLLEKVLKSNINVDHEKEAEIQEINIQGHNGIYYIKDNVKYVVVVTDDIVLNIMCDNEETNLRAFAEKIEKR